MERDQDLAGTHCVPAPYLRILPGLLPTDTFSGGNFERRQALLHVKVQWTGVRSDGQERPQTSQEILTSWHYSSSQSHPLQGLRKATVCDQWWRTRSEQAVGLLRGSHLAWGKKDLRNRILSMQTLLSMAKALIGAGFQIQQQ